MNTFKIIWKFSRPHTIIGSVISITTLYLMAYDTKNTFDLTLLLLSIVVGVTCNVFIVGINQVSDIDIDRINKPELPIPAGVLSLKQAKNIVYAALIICYSIAAYISMYLLVIVVLSTFIGWAYSMPPFHLKKHHLSAAIAIATVRGVLLNAYGFLLFNFLLNNSTELTDNAEILTLFVIAYSVVISWFKDLSDIEGDAKFKINTLAISYSPKIALIIGNIIVSLAYLYSIVNYANNDFLQYGHVTLWALFILNTFSIKLSDHDSVRKYYKRFWWFFFAEYLLYLADTLIKIYPSIVN
jgi:homogentisate phytyltransferase/homogentisate geranylgeranyltransferase